jgi:protein-glutamine gamma-glutamyltransferase
VPLYQIFFRRRRRQALRRRNPAGLDTSWPGLDSEFYQLEKKLLQHGLHRDISEPLPVWLQRLAADPGLANTIAPLHELLRLHYRYRFDPLGLTRSEREHLKHGTRAALTELPPGCRRK